MFRAINYRKKKKKKSRDPSYDPSKQCIYIGFRVYPVSSLRQANEDGQLKLKINKMVARSTVHVGYFVEATKRLNRGNIYQFLSIENTRLFFYGRVNPYDYTRYSSLFDND